MNTASPNWIKQITLFLTAQTISLFGSSVVQYAIIWHITLATSSGLMLTISTICGFLPQIFISFFAGVWIDRYNRKKIIIYSDGAIAFSTLITALCFLAGYQNLWLLFTVLAVRSIGTGIQTPAVNAIIPQLVPSAVLMKINSYNSSIFSLMMFLAPAVSGAVLIISPLTTVFFIDVITAVIGIGLMFNVRVPSLVQTNRKTPFSHFIEISRAFSYLKRHFFIRLLLIFQISLLLLVSPSAFLMPLLVSRSFGTEIWRLTVTEMTFSAGAVIGSIFLSWWGGFANRFNTTIFAGCLYSLLMVAIGLSPLFTIFILFNTLIGITMPLYTTPLNVIIQEQVPARLHGRIFSLMQISASAALPLGMVLFGPLADIISVQTLLIICGSGAVLTTFFVFRRYQAAT